MNYWNEQSAQPDDLGLRHDPKAHQPDHSGLQHVPEQPEQDAPELVSHSNRYVSVERRSSMNSPEVHNQKKNENFAVVPGSRATQGQEDGRAYYGQQTGYPGEPERQHAVNSNGKRVCALRRKVFCSILAIVVLVVVAAVLGGVLGTVLGGSSSKNTAPRADPGSTSGNSSSLPSTNHLSGLAAIQPAGDSNLYQYYQDPSGRILENQYAYGQWSIQGDDVTNSAIVVRSAMSGTPIAATSWSNNGATFRQIFYIDENGLVLTTNTTGTNTWSTPYNCLPTDSAAPDSIALAVVSDTNENALNGIRLYYASGSGKIQEVGIDFAETSTPGWNQWAYFPESDPTRGVATVLSGTVNHLYFVNTTTGALQQWTWDYAAVTSWKMGASATTTNIRSGSDIAAVNDGHSNDYIFYQDSNNNLIRSLYYGSGIESVENLGAVAETSKLTAVYNTSTSNEGAFVYYQQSNDTNIGFQEVNRAGQKIDSGTVG